MSKLFSTLVSYALFLSISGLVALLLVFSHYGKAVDDYRQLATYEPPITSRLYAADGRLLAEYASEKRAFVPYEDIPKQVVQAFISAEDKKFFSHGGIDFIGIGRAILSNIKNIGKGRRMIGASTITQQVAKNFLLTNEASLERKIKEAILATRIERAFSKEYIMELYLNQIYLGYYSYGVAAAALNYFNKSLDELTIAETAFLAALPKGPNNYDPVKRREEAIERRNWVLSRMRAEGYITEEQETAAAQEDIVLATRPKKETASDAEYFAEEVRRIIVGRYGENALYTGGLTVRTTVDPEMQQIATSTLRQGLINYDRRHGYRGPITHINIEDENWLDVLLSVNVPTYAPSVYRPAIVLAVDEKKAEIGLPDDTKGTIPLTEVQWAKKNLPAQTLGPDITGVDQVLSVGDVIWVQNVKHGPRWTAYPENTYALRQIPNVEGAMVALDPHTGRVLAMAGGFDFKRSQFNRAVQAKRQPGSAFKPFIYLAGLDEGLTPSSLILDAPFVMDQGEGKPKWKPKNISKRFYGETTMRVGIEKSRNLMTVRLAKRLGIPKIIEYAKKFGISDDLPNHMSIALGSGETTVLRLAAAYGMLVNGGKKITPVLIDRIQDRMGTTVYNSDSRPCEGCKADSWDGGEAPKIPDIREQIADPRSAYQMVNILTGVLSAGGSAGHLRSLGKTFAGKSGTSNDSLDNWFVGFSPDLVVAVFLGFDEPRTLGAHDTGGGTAAPIFKSFVQKALKGHAPVPFRIPPGIRLVRVNHQTGLPAKRGDKNVVLEAFKVGDEVNNSRRNVIDGSDEETYRLKTDGSSVVNTRLDENEDDDDLPDVGGLF